MTEKQSTFFDPMGIGQQWFDMAARAQAVMTQMVDQQMSASLAGAPPPAALGRLFASLAADPAGLGHAQFKFWEQQADLWRRVMAAPHEGAPAPAGDRRFRSEDWKDNIALNAIMHSYLIGADWLRKLVASQERLSGEDKRELSFLTEQLIDATAPTNLPFVNPDVVRRTLESGGVNLVSGFSNFLDDVAENAGHVRRASSEAFELGVNIAATKGSVVLRTPMMELIQYDPTTDKVREAPMLLVPPWVNKYYIFDLQQKSSFIRWAVEQGFTVFAISWVNPGPDEADKDFDHYWTEGPLAAFAAIEKATGQKRVNLFAYCLGGILAAAGLAALADRGDDRVASATLVATLTDFSDLGDFQAFVGSQNIAAIDQRLKTKGYLESADLSRLFSLLRANDLIWSAAISSYLLADKAVASDLLYWFSDGIGMPGRMLDTFLKDILLDNALATPGRFRLAGAPVDFTKITTPMCFVSLRDDHVANWKNTYKGALRFTAPKRFILGGSGHNAGTINPPAQNKHGYWLNDSFPADPDEWLTGAVRHEGSWWTEWSRWLAARSGRMVKARKIEGGPLPVLEAAPGSYARVRR